MRLFSAQLKSGGKSLKWSLPLRTGEKKESLINPKRKGFERGQEIKRKTSQHMTYTLSHRLEFDNRTVCRLSLFSEMAV